MSAEESQGEVVAPDWPTMMSQLRRPFTAAAVKFKPLTKPYDGKSSAAFYIDARLVADRLNEAVGPGNWSDDYSLIAEGRETPALYYPIVCRLTVCGVTKSDVGQGANTIVDDKAWKSAYSDALKRAAVKFGIGAYLYGIPRLYAPVDVGSDGKAKGFSRDGKRYLVEKYTAWLASPLNTYGDPLDHGDVNDDEPEAAPEPSGARRTRTQPQSDPAPVLATPEQVEAYRAELEAAGKNVAAVMKSLNEMPVTEERLAVYRQRLQDQIVADRVEADLEAGVPFV